ncbi:MAG: hypothetical protein EZS28_040275 [Streblomastix strix]|uniref:Uncharacterized protein n=1 Tax=Streblomastix strix TaxID=222440 RepID=A0A5J4U1G4_9EUKA|nr:MAG: hypothetical protein EZS28_040275 [Streblomastix strix]
MLDSTAYANGNQSVVLAVTTSELATVNVWKEKTSAQLTSLLPSRSRSPKIFEMPNDVIYEYQTPHAFLPPLANISSRKATNSVKRESFEFKVGESFEFKVGESDMMQVKQRDTSSSDRPYSNL